MEKYVVSDGNGNATAYEVERLTNGEVRIRQEGRDEWHVAQLEAVGDSGLFLLLLDHRPVELYIEGRGQKGAMITIGRHNLRYEVDRWRPSLLRRAAGRARSTGTVDVRAPMTGMIVDVLCAPGERVEQGQVLLIMESMKMNNEIRAPAAGELTAVEIAAGQRVSAGALMVRIRVDSGGEGEGGH